MAYFKNGTDAIKYVRNKTDTIMLSFSRGKDSIAAWLVLREHFPRIIPVHMHAVPHLSFVDESLAYYEKFFGTHIIDVMHPAGMRTLNQYGFQSPENCSVIELFRIPNLTFNQLFIEIGKDLGLEKPWVATGVRGCDTLVRRTVWKRFGAVTENTHKFKPIIEYTKDDVLKIITANGVKLPYDYVMFGRTIGRTIWGFLKPLKEHLPDDFERIKDFYPMVDVELLRREYADDERAFRSQP